jgi:predicted DNA-binding transcriptional regulator YafY
MSFWYPFVVIGTSDADRGLSMSNKAENIFGTPGLRLVQMYVLLSSTGRPYTLGRLADIFRCSRQTILRMMEQVQCIPQASVESWLEGKERLYRIPISTGQENVALTSETIQYLLLCQKVVSHLFPLDDSASGANSGHAGSPSPSNENGFPGEFAKSWVKGHIDYRPFKETLLDIHKALREQRLCNLTYQAHTKKDPKQYLIAPSSIVVYREALYLRCQLYDPKDQPSGDFRTFAVHRIRGISLCKEAYDADQIEEREPYFGFPYHEPIKVRVAFWGGAANYIEERTWSEDQKVARSRDGKVTLSFTTTSRLEVISWVLGFGGEAELLSPKDLREELVKKVNDIGGRYG